MSTDVVIDVSHWQGRIAWHAVAGAGIRAAYLKCTNGAHQTDDTYPINRDGAKAVGIKAGGYSFLLSDQAPEEQADKLLSNLGATDLRPVVDCEYDIRKPDTRDKWLDVPQDSIIAMIGRFCLRVKASLGVPPLIYSNNDWWTNRVGTATEYKGFKFADCGLWLARYAKKMGSYPPAFHSPVMWQYTYTAKLPGIAGTVDRDLLYVPLESLYLKR
jgi:GH25 family lysozyme M1 (1,4-beta-N-acetylmuramidase)